MSEQLPQGPPRQRSRFTRLPPQYGWEFLRRHPDYLRHWQRGSRYWELSAKGQEAADGAELAELAPSVAILHGLGISGPEYPEPSRTAEDLELHNQPSLHVARPLTCRDMVQCLAALPGPVREQIGRLLLGVEDNGDYAAAAGQKVIDRLHTRLELLNHKHLDRAIIGTVRFNEYASLGAITTTVRAIVQDLKNKLGIHETRQRDDCLDGYLRVWDMREGWQGGHYDGASERSLRAMALELGEPLQTVQSRYKSAFAHITGQPYDPTLWASIFLGPDLRAARSSGWLRQSKRASWRRQKQQRTGDPLLYRPGTATPSTVSINETSLSPTKQPDSAEPDGGDCVSARESARPGKAQPSSMEEDYAAMVEDLRVLLAQGKSNQDIHAAMDWTLSQEDGIRLIETLRGRGLDGLL